jgi:hypothetical protein
MVARPLDERGDADDQEGLPGALQEDIRTVAEAASEAAGEEEVSSHEVVEALTSNWSKIQTLGRFWDRHR